MYLEIFLYSGLVAGFTFFVRSTFRLIAGKWGHRHASDVWFHLYFINEIRENGHKIPKKTSKTLTSGHCTYPFFVHWCLSFLGKQKVERIEPFFSPAIDTICNLFLFFSSMSFLSNLGLSNNLEAAFLASTIFAFTPMLVIANERSFSLSARAFGEMLFSISTFLMFQFYWTNNFLYFLISTIIVSLIFLSSRFAVQVVVIFYLVFALFFRSIWFFLPVPFGIFFATVFTRGSCLTLLRGHLRNLSFWRTTVQFKHAFVLNNEPFTKVISALPNLIHNPKGYFKILYKNPISKMLIYNPFIVIWTIGFFVDRDYRNPLFLDLSVWLICGIVTVFIISIKYLLFLGEPERYFEYAVFPLSILSAYQILNSKSYLLPALLLAYSSCVIFTNYKAGINMANLEPPGKIDEVVEYLNSIPESKNILTIPTFFARQIVYFTHHKAVSFSSNLASTKENEEEFLLVFPNLYDYPNRNLDLLINRFNLDLIVTKRGSDKEYDFSKFHICFENEEFVVYGLRKEG